MLAQAGVVFGQSAAVVDLKDFRPREVKSAVFSLASAQDVRVEAVGAESRSERGTFSWVTAMWNGKNDGRRDPWMGNAWILDLKSRRVVWELSAASTERGRRNTRAFAGAVRLPAGTYEAFYSPFPNMYWTDEKGDASTTQRFLNWLADEGFDEFRMTIRGNAQVLERRRRRARAPRASRPAPSSRCAATAPRNSWRAVSSCRGRPRSRSTRPAKRARTPTSTPAGSSTPTRARKSGS